MWLCIQRLGVNTFVDYSCEFFLGNVTTSFTCPRYINSLPVLLCKSAQGQSEWMKRISEHQCLIATDFELDLYLDFDWAVNILWSIPSRCRSGCMFGFYLPKGQSQGFWSPLQVLTTCVLFTCLHWWEGSPNHNASITMFYQTRFFAYRRERFFSGPVWPELLILHVAAKCKDTKYFNSHSCVECISITCPSDRISCLKLWISAAPPE